MIIQLRALFLAVCLVFCLTACGSKDVIEQRILPKRNPTAYEFDASLDRVKQAIQDARGDKWRDAQASYEKPQLAWQNSGNPFAVKVFSDPSNKNDAVLCGVGMGQAVGKSSVYIKDGQELTYYADFQIHLTAINPSRIQVEIRTFDSHVLGGTEWHPFAEVGVFLVVEPTSVEEYQILLDTGKQLGVNDMPKLILPDSNSPIKKIRTVRRR